MIWGYLVEVTYKTRDSFYCRSALLIHVLLATNIWVLRGSEKRGQRQLGPCSVVLARCDHLQNAARGE